MPPFLALLLCYGLIIYLFRWDMSWRRAGSVALLIPGIWLAIQGSRPLSLWFGSGSADSLEANPINTAVFGIIILISVLVLARRTVDWAWIFDRNKALWLIYCYFAISALWAEIPAVSAKRVLKDFSCVLVALVILTGRNPAEAFRAVVVRVSYLLFPLSEVFIKYYPEIGRQFSRAGDAMFTGVTTQKNSLGEMLFVFSLVILWDLTELMKRERTKAIRVQCRIHVGMLLLAIWLLIQSDSKTSIVCLVIGATAFLGSQYLVRMRRGRTVLISCVCTIGALALLDGTLGLSEPLFRLLGRDSNLTGRTQIWDTLLSQKTDPWIGEGFYMFWDTEKGYAVKEALITLVSAHNGYIETYLDGGLLGCMLLLLLLLSGFVSVQRKLFTLNPFGGLALAYWVTAVIYNFSESSFFRLDPLWFMLLVAVLNEPKLARAAAAAATPFKRHSAQRMEPPLPLSARSAAARCQQL